MNISRKKFVITFLIFAFVFMFISNTLFGSGPQVFTQPPEPWLGTPSPVAWKTLGHTILLPIKAILVGPMLATGNFLREDPPPPFVATVFVFYWTILALVIHHLLGKLRYR